MFNLVLDDSCSSLFSSKFSVLHSVVGEMLGGGNVNTAEYLSNATVTGIRSKVGF